MWKLEVSHNQVSSIPSMAFYGLERALWELHLPHNQLTRIPSDSLTLLKKLSVLNLAGKFSFLPDVKKSKTAEKKKKETNSRIYLVLLRSNETFLSTLTRGEKKVRQSVESTHLDPLA